MFVRLLGKCSFWRNARTHTHTKTRDWPILHVVMWSVCLWLCCYVRCSESIRVAVLRCSWGPSVVSLLLFVSMDVVCIAYLGIMWTRLLAIRSSDNRVAFSESFPELKYFAVFKLVTLAHSLQTWTSCNYRCHIFGIWLMIRPRLVSKLDSGPIHSVPFFGFVFLKIYPYYVNYFLTVSSPYYSM